MARLTRNNIAAEYASTGAEARERLLEMIPQGAVVGYGDSLTLEQIGLVRALEQGPYTFLNPWAPGNSVDENIRLKKRILTCDVLVTGSNAITLEGEIVNVDGHGNRVAAMLFGPDKVLIAVGINKLVPDLPAALARIRNVAAPANVARHPNFDPMPPCGMTGVCSDCDSAWRICNKTVIIRREFANARYAPRLHVVIIGEALGL
jgi:L-lactate utilization protein LutB